jgi:hypothetical protein
MGQLLHDRAGEITPQAMADAMGDQVGQGDCRICRTDPADTAATCAAAIMSPQQGRMWAAKGAPSEHRFETVDL